MEGFFVKFELVIPILVATLPTLCVQIFTVLNRRRDEKQQLRRLEDDLQQLMAKITRVEIMALCDHDRGGAESRHLLELYDKYKAMGGNSYIDAIVAKKREDLEI
jgi:hypothetical protein